MSSDPQIPWTPRVPSGWSVQRAKTLLYRSKTLNADRIEQHVLSLTLRGVVDNNIDNPEGLVPEDYATYQLFERDDLVFKLIDLENVRTSRVGLVPRRGIMSSAYLRLRPRSGTCVRFLYWSFFDLYNRQIFNHLGSGVRSTLGGDDVLNLPLAVPELATQRAIADYLDAETARIDALITKKQRMIKLLDEHRSELRREAVESIVDSGVPLSQFRRMVRTTHAGEVIDQSWWGDGQETLFTCAREPVRSSFEIFLADRRTTGDEILLTRNGTPYVHLPPPGAIYTNVVQRVVLDHRLDRVFASVALDVASRQMHRQGVSIDSLNFTMWKELRIPVPSLELQQALMKRLGEAESRHRRNVDLHERQIALLLERRQALITAAVTGELVVPGVAA